MNFHIFFDRKSAKKYTDLLKFWGAINFFMLQMWMVGRQIGVDRGGILNRSPTLCPEDSTVDWEYWSTAWEVSAVRKIKTPIFSVFWKKVVNIATMELGPVSYECLGNSTYYRGNFWIHLFFLKNNGYLNFNAVITISQKILWNGNRYFFKKNYDIFIKF